jgi:iron complex transport system ATP-binding protein
VKVRVENLRFAYRSFELRVDRLVGDEARITAVVGPNGAGKSTLLKCLARLLPIPPGIVFVDGRDLAALHGRERARLIGYVPQEPSFVFNYAVLDFVLTGRAAYLAPFASPSAADRRAAEEALSFVGLGAEAGRPFLELSSGERRLVLIARTLAQQSEILLLDEPTTFLDPRHEAEVMALLRRLADEKRKTLLITLHDLDLAARGADAMVFLREGRVVAAGPAAEVLTEDLLRRVYDLDLTILEHAGRKIVVK